MLTGLLSWLKALTCSDKGLLLLVGRMIPCPSQKELWLDGWMVNEPRFGIGLLVMLCDMGLNHFGWRAPWLGKAGRAAFELYPGLALQLRTSPNLSQGSWVVRHFVARLDSLFRDILGCPAEHQSSSVACGWLQSALARHKYLPSFWSLGLPVSANLCRKSQLVLWCWWRMESPNPNEFACYQCTKVR
jgi:hypothetical protein